MSVKQLYDLQSLDLNIEAVEQRLVKALTAVKDSSELNQARANLARANAELLAIKAEQKNTEFSITDISAKMAAATTSLYSGRINNPKELQSLQQEIASLQNQRNPLEETDLSLMEKLEAAGSRVEQLNTEFSQVEKKWLAEQKTLLSQIESDKHRLQELKSARAASAAAVPAADLALYNQLKKTRGIGIARLEQGTCGKCRLGLSTAEVQRARAGQMVTCSSCGRLLYFE